MSKTAEHVDRAMTIETDIGEKDVVFYDVRKAPFKLYGLYNPTVESEFKRLPDHIGKNTNEGVEVLYTNTAGGRVRFATDSPYIAIHAEMSGMAKMSHFSLTGTSAFDLYIDEFNGDSHFAGVFKPPYNADSGFESKVPFGIKRMRNITINFPTYANVKNLYIGLSESAILDSAPEYAYDKPVVYYGSSITQGGCVGRPGNTYQSVITQRMNVDHINLGFSGSGRGEEIIANYIAGLEMCAFVMDYDHNAPSIEHLKETHYRLYKTVRDAQPELPIIMMSKTDFFTYYEHNIQRRNVVFETYKTAIDRGDKNVYYIDGESVYRGPYESLCTVDGVHPTEMGFALIADAVEHTLKKAFRGSEK